MKSFLTFLVCFWLAMFWHLTYNKGGHTPEVLFAGALGLALPFALVASIVWQAQQSISKSISEFFGTFGLIKDLFVESSRSANK
jgi:hypothetical protein